MEEYKLQGELKMELCVVGAQGKSPQIADRLHRKGCRDQGLWLGDGTLRDTAEPDGSGGRVKLPQTQTVMG